MSGRIIGNYRILEYIGSGGFGSVFKAEDVKTVGRIVAIKELHKKHSRSAVIKQRFFQEAVAMARLDHPNLPRLFTFGEDNGAYYLVMEFLSGALLTDEIQEKGAVPLERAVHIASQTLEAISYAHRNGIIHRDLKPDNIMLTGDPNAPQVKVLDFGIARMVGGENLTMTGEGFGTPTYMSPERIALGTEVDHRTDIYAVGIILFEMLTGRVPFSANTTDPALYWAEMRRLHQAEPLPSLSSAGVPELLESIVRKAAAKRPDERYESADSMIAQLKSLGLTQAQPAATSPTEESAKLLLMTSPGNADVFVDDVVRGTSDQERGRLLVEGLTPGQHRIKVTKFGYNDYGINLVLEAGKRTDLQVALAARATMVAPPENPLTGPTDFATRKLDPADAEKTLALIVQGLPAGATVFVGSESAAQADQDGRATLKLNAGVHEIRASSPTGESYSEMVNVSERDTGALRTMQLPFTQPMTSTEAFTIVDPLARTRKKVATVASIILVLALGVTAYFVLRDPGKPTATGLEGATGSNEANQMAQSQSQNFALDRNATQQGTSPEVKGAATETPTPKQRETPAAAATPTPVPSPTPAATPEGTPDQTPASQGGGCVGVVVTSPAGMSTGGLRVVLTEPATNKTLQGRTGQAGRWFTCGLTSGNTFRVTVFNPRGAVLGGTQGVATAGRTMAFVEVRPPRTPLGDGPVIRPQPGTPPPRPFPRRRP